MNTFSPTSAFDGRGQVKNATYFVGKRPNNYVTSRNKYAPHTKNISTGIGKAIMSMKDDISGFAFCKGPNDEDFYLLENKAVEKSILYNIATEQIYHTCQQTQTNSQNGQGIFCYHMFMFVAMYDASHNQKKSSFLPNYKVIKKAQESGTTIGANLEKEFLTAMDEVFCTAMEKFDGKEIHDLDDLPFNLDEMSLEEDMTQLVLEKDGVFNIFGSAGPTTSPKKKAQQQAEEDAKDWAMRYKDFSDDELANIKANKEKVEGKSLQHEQMRMILPMLSTGAFKNLVLKGPSGTGKTTSVQIVAKMLSIPVYIQNYSMGTEEAQILGENIPNPDPSAKHPFIWQDGLLTKCVRYGGIYMADEVNMGKPDVLAVLNNLLDGVEQITISGQTINRHPNCIIIVAYNHGYEGTKLLNKAWKNRFDAHIKFREFTKAECFDIVKRSIGFTDDKLLNQMIDAQLLLREYITSPVNDVDAVTTIRNLIAWAKLVKAGINVKAAAEIAVLEAAFEEEEHLEAARLVIDGVFA